MGIKAKRAQERLANKHLLLVDCFQGDDESRLWILVDGHSHMIRDIRRGSSQVHELLLERALPRLIATDNNGRPSRNGRKGAGDVQ